MRIHPLTSVLIAATAFLCGFVLARSPLSSAGGDRSATSAGASAEDVPALSRHRPKRAIAYHPPASAAVDDVDEFTRDELEEARRVSERFEAGEYVLPFDNPVVRKDYSNVQARWVEEASNRVQRIYDPFFAGIGVDPYTNSLLQQHLVTIHRASIQAEQAIQQLLTARRDFDVKVRNLLSTENYEAYRAFERGIPVDHELALIKKHAQMSGQQIRDEDFEVLGAAIDDSRAFSEAYWHGPYDALPEVAVGAASVIELLSRRRDELQRSLKSLEEHSGFKSAPPSIQTLARASYDSRLSRLHDAVSNIVVWGRLRPPDSRGGP